MEDERRVLKWKNSLSVVRTSASRISRSLCMGSLASQATKFFSSTSMSFSGNDSDWLE